MGSRYFQRPENAISKAEEFMKVGKPSRALDTLYDVIKSKKRNHQYSEKLIEEIMFKYLELCVDLKKSHVAKEGLFQYRNMCQSVNVASLASVVQGYLNMAEKRTEAARQESVDKVEVDDLDNIATPEMIMLSAVSGEGAQDRSDRTILMPWVKFLWESYCQCLELLRTNSRVERLYHDIAQQAFKFCLKYQRKTEFRKLCDKLRNHLDLIIKQVPKQNNNAPSINLNNAETQQMNLDTRLVQLDAAIHMELWQEAYKAVEDIHGLMQLSKKTFAPKMMANYYQKLALVFWKSDQYLFHAAAVFKHFQLTRDMKRNISSEELAKMASRVLAAVLCVPLPSQHPEFDRFIETDRSPAEKMARLALLLSLSQPPTRASLLRDCERFNVVTAASPEMQDLYNWLEVEFHPLNLCEKVDLKLKDIDENEELASLKQYDKALRDITLIRLLKQVAQVYQSIQLSRLIELAKFSTSHHLERLIVESARQNDMQVRIDHRTRSVVFGTDLTESQRTDLKEGPHLQAMPSEQVRTQLMSMLAVLDKCTKTIHPDQTKIENLELRQRIVEAYHQSKVRDHQRLLARHKIIEERKEWLEKLNTANMVEIARKEEERRIGIKLQETARLEKEREERDKRRKEEEIKDIQLKHTKDKLAQLASTDIGKKVLDKMDAEEIEKLDADEIMAKQVEELEKEKKELQIRLKSQEKKVDHFQRALRLEEVPLLKEQYEGDKDAGKVIWMEQEQERIEQEKKDRTVAEESQLRLAVMKDDKDKYLENLLQERKNVFDRKLKEFTTTLETERVTRMEKRKEERKEERRTQWHQEKEEDEQRRKDEAAVAEKERLKEEEEERRRVEAVEYERKKAELDALEEKKKIREKEIEEREKERARERDQEEEKRRAAERAPDRSSWRREGEGEKAPMDRGPRREERREEPRREERGGEAERPGGAWKPPAGGGWRDREKKKEGEWDRKADERPPPRREDDRPAPRRDDDRPAPRREDDRPAPRRDDDPPRGGEGAGGWRRRDASPKKDDGPPRRDFGRRDASPRRDDGPRRDFGTPGRRDLGESRDDRGPRRDFGGDSDRGPRRDFGGDRDSDRAPRRDFGGDRDAPPRRDFGREEDRGPRRDAPDEGPSDWRRDRPAPAAREERERPAPRREDAGDQGGGSWRAGPKKDETPPPKREEPRPAPKQEEPKPQSPGKDVQDDGWTTVATKR